MMLDYQKKSEFLVGIDSDGTIMDTMTIKHVRCFGPKFIEVFKISSQQEEILTEWNRLNLYSKTRGINRFQGLKAILEFVNEKYKLTFSGTKEFFSWVDSTKELSPSSLEKELTKNINHDCINLALVWSKEVNEAIKLLPETKAFVGVKEILKRIEDKADLVGVSSANAGAVKEEWTRLGIISSFKEVACQDKGTKKEIVSKALELGYLKSNSILLGDAIGDYKAAKDNGIWFYPIIPGKEVESWSKFEETLNILLNHQFDQAYQDKLINEFYNSLK